LQSFACVAMSDLSSESSDCHIVKGKDSNNRSSARQNVKVETSPEPGGERNSSSTLQDEELTGSYTVSSSTRDDFNVRIYCRTFYNMLDFLNQGLY